MESQPQNPEFRNIHENFTHVRNKNVQIFRANIILTFYYVATYTSRKSVISLLYRNRDRN